MKIQQHLLLYILFIFSVLFFSCKESNSTLPEIDLKEMDEYVFKITSILDTAKVGDVDGTYPRESKIALQKALVDLQVGKSKADAGEFILQYEVNNYCINAGKAIQDFFDSYQQTLPPNTNAELRVFGIDQKGYIDFGSSADYIGSKTFTVESWLKYNSGFYEFAIGAFLATFNNAAQPIEGWMINFMGQNLRATIGMGPQNNRLLEWGSLYPTNYGEWNHIAMVYDETLATEQLKLYVNGKVFFSKTNDIVDESGVIQSYQPNIVDTRMWAFQQPTDHSRCITGYIKKLRIWNSAKTMAEINLLMTSEVAGNENDLLCAWDFTKTPSDSQNIPDKTGGHSAKLMGKYKWYPIK
jgi:hypothetical protein